MNYELSKEQIENLVTTIFHWRQKLYQKSFFYLGFFAFILVLVLFYKGLSFKALLNCGFAALTVLLGLIFQIGRKNQIRGALGEPGKRTLTFDAEKITYTVADCPSGFWWNQHDIISVGVSDRFLILIGDDTSGTLNYEVFTHAIAVPLDGKGTQSALDELQKLCVSNGLEIEQIKAREVA